jgi:hypothetical protein
MRATDLDPEELYNEHFAPLVDLALSKDVPFDVAEQLANDVLLASLLHLRKIDDLRLWLAGALTCAITTRQGGSRPWRYGASQ